MGWVDGWIGELMDDRWMGGCLMDGVGEWMEGWMDGWTVRCKGDNCY